MADEVRRRSIRILMDLQACQTSGSGSRGVGRYAKALFSNIAMERGQRDLFALVASHLPVPVDPGAVDKSRVLRFTTPPAWGSPRDYLGGEEDTLDGLALSAFVAPLKPDILHVAHVFEGFGERVALPSYKQRPAGQLISATLYDLIPLLYQEHYFQDDGFRKWYFSRLNWLRQADLLLAISESSRQDAINLLGIEPWRIVTIHGGISPHFRPAADLEGLRRDLVQRYGLRERFVLYTGGDDHRKNIRGAIAGYAAVPPEVRKNCQLVIVCSMDDHRKKMYLDVARQVGLDSKDVLITGFISEEYLVAFYNTCDVFVFPSLYEGLGLPVLEAMACGAPVVGGNNSSVRELIVRPDALFDAGSPHSIGDMIGNALTNKAFTEDLRHYGLKRSKEFSWKHTAGLAIDAFDDALSRARGSGVQCAVQGWLPRKRMAVFSPLPPCRSGIADYSAKFLPHLARHFDIDLYVDNYQVTDETLTSAFRIFNASDFDAVAQAYDAILYEFGNSEFHAHMLPLLEKYPGIVGLHDAYLSGLSGYLDFHLGETGRYAREMLTAHGPVARRLFAPIQCHPNANGDAMVNLPCTKRVIDQAIGIISHSPFNLDVARRHYPEGWRSPYRIIPQMVPVPRAWSKTERDEARKQFDFAEGDMIIATFGHIAWTKWGDRLLEAFLNSPLRDDPGVYLVYAGELAKDDFGLRLKDAIKKAKLGKRIHITGFLSERDYEQYLRITDIAVQLRTKSRGGTPKAVLDCLAFGVPVIVNNDASYTDYPDNVVIKLDAEPSVGEIAQGLVDTCAGRDLRMAFVHDGLGYVRERHDPARCAAEYAAAIHEFMERDQQLQPKNWISSFAPHLADCPDPQGAARVAADWIEHIPTYQFRRRRLIIDVSHIAQSDHQTGIPRVVKQIVRELYCSERTDVEPLAVELIDGVLRVANAWLHGQGLLVSHETESQAPASSVEFRAGDILLMLDSSWARYREFSPVFAQARQSNVPVYMAVYDLLPLTLSPENFVDGGPEWFEGWFRDAVSASDGLVCISRTIAEDVAAFLDKKTTLTKWPKIGFWHLGSDFTQKRMHSDLNPKVSALADRPYLLMVGTIEPRKSHALALDAMERLWAQGRELCLCIAGKEGWMVGELMERLHSHPLAGSKLFLIEHSTDADIAFLYAQAAGLLFLSKGEGFGLPLVEAAHHGIPIICSDIRVFHEIAGDFATYVNFEDADLLAHELTVWWGRKLVQQLPDTRKMPRMTWEQSAGALLSVVFDDNWMRE